MAMGVEQLKVANIVDSSVGKCQSIISSNYTDFKDAFSPLKNKMYLIFASGTDRSLIAARELMVKVK